MASRKGSPNKATAQRERIYAEGGLMPLAFMLQTLRDTDQPFEKRMAAARDAAPYVHPKLANVQMSGDKDQPLTMTITWQPPAQS